MKIMSIENLQPKHLWESFSNVCKIPHPSGHEKALCAYIKKMADELGLEAMIDHVGNLIIKKPATPGMENCKGVILQAHLDMVPEVDSDVIHDFLKDPIQPYVDGEWVKAKGTTLGADNGIGVAAIMAVMQAKNLKHGPLEALLTVSEETALTGAFGLQPGILKGEILLNLDNYMDNLVIGCAGGKNVNVKMQYAKASVPVDSVAIKVNISGLKGGHSAGDIHLPRGNAIKLMTHLLLDANNKYPIAIATFNGGTAHNAIPREAEAVVVVPRAYAQDFLKLANETADYLKNELKNLKTSLKTFAAEVAMPDHVLAAEFQRKLLFALSLCPSGVIGMSADIPGLVETSNNLAVIKFDVDAAVIEIRTFQRGSIEFIRKDVSNLVKMLFDFIGAEVSEGFSFPAWTPNKRSPIVKLVQEIYEKNNGKKPEITATHGGLETGVFLCNYPHLDMVSIGATMQDEHSPSEKVNIKSVAKFWELLTEILANISKI
jgi:dipeptidase D